MGATMSHRQSHADAGSDHCLPSGDRTTSGLLEAIEGARTKPEELRPRGSNAKAICSL